MVEDQHDPSIGGLPPPRATERLFGHTSVWNALVRARDGQRLHHGVLLSGPRGVGKATLAYAFAKVLISGAADLEAALAHPVHRRIAGGAAQEFRRLTRGFTKEGRQRNVIAVEDVRALEPFLNQKLETGQWRAVLIDAVDDLNASSANALLKVLEEPGERTLFLLVSHNEGSILPTIRSRCVTHRMERLSDEDLRNALADSSVETGAIDAILPLAGGSVRRAIALADDDLVGAVSELHRLLDERQWSGEKAQGLSDRVAGRGSEDAYIELTDALVGRLGSAAVEFGREGRGTNALRAAEAAALVNSDLARMEEYGVDRRIAFRRALDVSHAALHAG